MARDTAAIGDNVVIGENTPPVETTVEALIRAYNRLPLNTNLTDGDTVTWDATNGVWVPGSGSSSLIGYAQHDPATTQNKATTSTTAVDVDATNLAVTFTVPDSGAVLVRLSADGRTTGSTNAYHNLWNIRTGTTDVTELHVISVSTNSLRVRASYAVVVTGLTPGASLTWKWGHATNDAGVQSQVFCGGANGPAVMEVWSA